jgi:hypothetical protein
MAATAPEQKLAVGNRARLAVVRLLNAICELVDEIAYRPAFVALTKRLPWFWCCQLAHLSINLDDRWQTGYWRGQKAPPAPDGPCDACGRRAGWLEIGGHYEGLEDCPPDEDEYLSAHPVTLCGWCHLDINSSGPPRNAADLDRLLRDAASRSIGWRWRWHPGWISW